MLTLINSLTVQERALSETEPGQDNKDMRVFLEGNPD